MVVDSAASERNVVISPLSLTLVFGALQTHLPGGRGSGRKEMSDVFGWGEYPNLDVPARMLLAAFDKPVQVHPQSKDMPHVPAPHTHPQGAWITNDLFYRYQNTLSERFVYDAEKYYGMKFRSTGSSRPSETYLERKGAQPKVSGKDDLLISSGVHLQTAWSGNTFSMSTPRKMTFTAMSGEAKQVEVLDSELSGYYYEKTDTFEAAVLPCNHVYMVVILPAPGESLHDVEQQLADMPELIDSALKKQPGIVTMPMFHFQFESNMRQQLEQLGVRKVFEDLGSIMKIPNSHLTDVSQRTDILVNKEGIQASAETIVGAVYGGIGFAQKPFHLELNRPFIFLIRDRVTNALMFLGVVKNPSTS